MWTREIFCRKVGDPAPVRSSVRFHALDRTLEYAVANRERERVILIIPGCEAFGTAKSTTQILAEILFDFLTCQAGANGWWSTHRSSNGKHGRANHGEEKNRDGKCECDHAYRSEEHTSELQSRFDLVCR